MVFTIETMNTQEQWLNMTGEIRQCLMDALGLKQQEFVHWKLRRS